MAASTKETVKRVTSMHRCAPTVRQEQSKNIEMGGDVLV
jgi:hypothetical protein